MYILGINAFHGDSSACILKDGVLIVAAEEERFRRIKHWAGFPVESITFCLEETGINISQVDYVTVSRNTKANFFHKIFHAMRYKVSIASILSRLNNLMRVSSIKKELSKAFNVPEKEINAKIYNIEHHRSHIASSFFASPFDKSAILSVDGFGDFTSTMFAFGENKRINVLDSVKYPHSLGLFYTAATQFLGFPNYGDEYKVMGLSGYGEAKYIHKLEEIIKTTDSGSFELNKNYFRHIKEGVEMTWENGMPQITSLFTNKWELLLGKARQEQENLEQIHLDIAASVQCLTENIIFHMLNYLHAKTRIKNICITGGVAQNSVINGKIIANTPFEEIYIPSAGHDAGTAIGSALYLYHHILGNDRLPSITHAYSGSKFSNSDIVKWLQFVVKNIKYSKANINYKEFDDKTLIDKVSDKLIDGGVIGWFQGRAEFGPRALGNRSILVDPRRQDVKDRLNGIIKEREGFRPFAPSILKEKVADYFEQSTDAPFMEKVFPIKKEKRKEIPAVTHVDGTGRLHTVDKKNSPKYHKLIERFEEKTGIPILLNTSFNENEPIVNKPEEALDCFLRTKMDMLVMENIIVEKN